MSETGLPVTDFREALEDMVGQFAHRGFKGKKRVLCTGGLSAPENAFDCLGWDDPHVVEDCGCEILECIGWATCVGAYPRSRAIPQLRENPMVGFGFLCGDHYRKWNGKDAEKADDIGRAPTPPTTGRAE